MMTRQPHGPGEQLSNSNQYKILRYGRCMGPVNIPEENSRANKFLAYDHETVESIHSWRITMKQSSQYIPGV